jgi:histidinol phosphatase-like enzyme (inositol monophosphatase family)
MIHDIEKFKEFGIKLADKSSLILNKYFRTKLKIENKEDHSPVTIADKNTEKIMRKMIMKEFPDHGILGEEYGEYNQQAIYKWVIDPIDGTKSFICGNPLFGTLIALLKNDYPILGIISLPILGDTLVGDNNITTLNGTQVSFRPCNNLASSVMLTTDISNISEYQDINKFNTLAKQVKLFRTWGDCYGYYLLATGYADIMIDPVMSSWDLLALIPIIKGAGGIITDYHGNDPLLGNSIIAASKNLHTDVIKILNGE